MEPGFIKKRMAALAHNMAYIGRQAAALLDELQEEREREKLAKR
jgi:hypothetical protein